MKGQNGKEPDWLEGYINKAYVPTDIDFQKLRTDVKKHRKVFNEVYQPIRHKLFAHNDKKLMGKADQLWAETNIDQLEEIIWFLYDLKQTLFQTYENGEAPVLQNRKPDMGFYESDYASLLDMVKGT